MTGIVFDSSVVIAILKEESGYEAAERLLGQALISSVNIAEIAAYLSRSSLSFDLIQRIVARFPFEIIPLDAELALHSGALFLQTKAHGLSLGDRACLALGLSRKLPVLTADSVWAKLGLPVDVRLLR